MGVSKSILENARTASLTDVSCHQAFWMLVKQLLFRAKSCVNNPVFLSTQLTWSRLSSTKEISAFSCRRKASIRQCLKALLVTFEPIAVPQVAQALFSMKCFLPVWDLRLAMPTQVKQNWCCQLWESHWPAQQSQMVGKWSLSIPCKWLAVPSD